MACENERKAYTLLQYNWLMSKTVIVKAKELIKQGETLRALSLLEKSSPEKSISQLTSLYAFCIARERGQIRKAIELCHRAINKEPDETTHYYCLGRIHLLDKNRREAIEVFREGLKHGTDQDIIAELESLGTRKAPPFKFLKRSNPLNKYTGLLLKIFGLR